MQDHPDGVTRGIGGPAEGDRVRGAADVTWEPIVRSFAPYVRAVAVREYGLADSEAEEVFQEVFLRAWVQHRGAPGGDAVQLGIPELAHRVAADRARAA
jgi:DNA-directed RNA polymerase specialized sigma24 family protein